MVSESLQSSFKYGPIYLAQPNIISISNSKDIRSVLGSSKFHKHHYYTITKFTKVNSIITTTDPNKAEIKL
ncbi:hypothetical protein BX661DRAFT_175104 [Kickxella alabastrina]|uniref:uncharacterized protein n=1 Tax=Kickxella alabastrina TaxID=61397 RepID=UPI00221F2E25|nr:uncharacterized protein BX661DRAFT_175104 [Kickxella alabastrina]KAI7834577.1 hypothetical protein BX661DRAFT_175104 [Kickxella alabastrina]